MLAEKHWVYAFKWRKISHFLSKLIYLKEYLIIFDEFFWE